MPTSAEAETGQGIEELLACAAAHIVTHEDPEGFERWLADEAPRFLSGLGLGAFPPEMARRLLGLLGRGIWNATPLPSQGYRPAPRPQPTAQGPCLCGSEQPYASCCGQLPPVPSIPGEAVWQALAEHGPLPQLLEAGRLGALPEALIGRVALRLSEAKRESEALVLLEGVLGPGHRLTSAATAGALELYVELVTELRGEAAGEALVERLLESVNGASRAVLWGRKAAQAAAGGDAANAWRCLESGLGDDPESPALVALELTLLASEGRFDEVAKRARRWRGQLRPLLASGEAVDLRDLLETAIADPHALARDEATASPGPEEGLPEGHQALVVALEAGLARPAPACALRAGAEGEGCLSSDDATRGAEAKWHAFWGRRDAAGRSPVTEGEVVALLTETPEIFDSLDVLHALAEIAEELERQGRVARASRLVDRLFERGEEILRRAMAAAPKGLRLPWSVMENRAGLELLLDSGRRHAAAGRREAARACAETLLALDPADALGAAALLAGLPAQARRSGAKPGGPRRSGRR